ncbi:MAG: ABC transporter ATP-binding protein [Pirellulaceae bacterium]
MSRLQVTNLAKKFPTAAGELSILEDVNLQLDDGQNLAIVGPSGSGKSTLLQIVGTLDSPTSGSVQLEGIKPFELSAQELSRFRNRKIGFVFQEHHLLPQLSALENVLLPVLAAGSITLGNADRARMLLAKVGLAERAEHLPSELSGGERQRVAVARALICEPVLLLADEPTGSLDQANAESIGKLLLEIQRDSGATLICVTHSQALAENFQRRAELKRGRLEFQP